MTSPLSEGLKRVLDNVKRETPEDIASYFDRLWPLLRSITGEGVRRTHDILGEILPLERMEIPSGTQVFDWIVPKEWVIREAYVITPTGQRILDIRDNNLHIVNYSVPFRGKISREELDKHLYSLPDMPDTVPYVLSYYKPRWGFCLTHRMRGGMKDGEYEVMIDAEHIDGSMTLSEAVLPGEGEGEILFSTYTCHPSMANNELSGPLVTAFLYRRMASLPRRRFTYRFVFLPETIGSITYLSMRGDHLKKHLAAGYVLSCIGDASPFTYKRSRQGAALADRAARYALSRSSCASLRVIDFYPDGGSDERQYCSPGFNLPVGVVARSIFGTYRQYHTHLDNRDFMSFETMVESVDGVFAICSVLETNAIYERTMPYGEPFMTKYNLYPTVSGKRENDKRTCALMWVLNFADGEHDLLSIAEKSGIDYWLLDEAASECVRAGLIRRKDTGVANS